MGHMQAMGLAAESDTFGLATMLAIHLTSNHYPPLPTAYIPLCEAAITVAADAVRADDDDLWDVGLDIPEDVDPRPMAEVDGQITVATAVRIFHLDAFVDAALADDDDDEF
jgi:hypothetical protein